MGAKHSVGNYWLPAGVAIMTASSLFSCGEDKKDDGSSNEGSGGASASGSGSASRGGASGDGGSTGSSGTGGAVLSQVPRQLVFPEASDDIIRNPERGFYRATNIIDESSLAWIEDETSLYFSYVRLDDYRDAEIPRAFLTEIEAGFQKVRAEGAKLILRFAYNFGPYPDSEPDASLDRVLGHIEQLAPLLEQNADVIATLQAGFIGAWGEWHTSTNGLDNPDDKRTVLEALLAALPTSRTVQIRYPGDLFD